MPSLSALRFEASGIAALPVSCGFKGDIAAFIEAARGRLALSVMGRGQPSLQSTYNSRAIGFAGLEAHKFESGICHDVRSAHQRFVQVQIARGDRLLLVADKPRDAAIG
jgi:hypothetical protein